MVDKADERKEYRLTGGCLDDGGFADTSGVEIDIGAFFRGFFFDVEIQELNDVTDEVR